MRTLIARDVAAVERALVTVTDDIAIIQGGGDVLVRPTLAECLALWHRELTDLVVTRAKKQGAPPGIGLIIASSAYRPLGTYCAMGTPFADEGGALDSQDEFGHWSGWAVDVPTRFTRESFFPIPTIEEGLACAARAGLIRPWPKSDWVHWTPAGCKR